MARLISNGQARRIAAEWQAPRNACSALQHVGIVQGDLIDELQQNLRSPHLAGDHDPAAKRELAALIRWAKHHGEGVVSDWGAWDDTPAR